MEKVKLGEICDILNGYAFKSKNYVDSGIRIIRITNVQNGFIEDNDPRYYDISEINNLKNYMLNENDLLISLTGNVGRVGLIKKELLPAGLNQRVGCLRIKDNKIVSIRYLYQYLNNRKFENDCINNSNGIAQKNLSTEWLKEYNIIIPDLNVQQKISKSMEEVQEIIDIRKKQIKKLDELIKSQFVKMFGTPFLNEKKWKMGIIRDVVLEAKYGTSRAATENGKYQYLRMNNITYNGRLDLSDLKCIDIPDNELEKCTTKFGDVLFNRTNSRELVGKTCIYNLDEKMVALVVD